MNYNFEDLLHVEYKKYITQFVFLIALCLVIVLSIKCSVYSFKEFSGIYKNNLLEITYQIEDKYLFENGYIKINNEKYNFGVLEYSEIFVLGEIYYQTVYLEIEEEFNNNQLLDITLFYNKERIIIKIKDLMF